MTSGAKGGVEVEKPAVAAITYQDFDAARVKHLELIQAVIARLGNNGFLVKGWTITIAAALFGFAVESDTWQLALVAVFVSLAFWALDAYFLRCERLFRELYRRVSDQQESIPPFFMAATEAEFASSAPGEADFWSAFRSGPLGYFFGPTMAAALLVAVIVIAGTR